MIYVTICEISGITCYSSCKLIMLLYRKVENNKCNLQKEKVITEITESNCVADPLIKKMQSEKNTDILELEQ